jgi:phosphoribosylformylglycinamidine (FGAM) synthase-like enzyme/phosphoribosylformylglycinamidine (FGAM) synthase PurS component
VTLYQIEVRANAEQYDVQAQQVTREIQKLPRIYLPSLAAISTSPPPLTISTSQLYSLTGQLTSIQLDQLIRLLIDPVTQEAELAQKQEINNTAHLVDIFFHPGVTDTLAEIVLTGALMLGITTLEHVETGRRYIFDKRLSEVEVRFITKTLLYNPVIQNYILHNSGIPNDAFHEPVGAIKHFDKVIPSPVGADLSRPSPMYRPSCHPDGPVENHNLTPTYIPLSEMTDQQLIELSKKGLLALNLDEMRTIQQHYKEQRREPTDVELETLAQTWSEHCSHKTFKATIHYQELDGDGKVIEQETIHGLLKQYLMRATQYINHPSIVSAFSDNAGIVRFTETQDIAFKVETHNHPSAIEPFGGANTGVGGVIRDILGVSAHPIACTDILCFGPPDTSTDELPAGILSPHRIASGVVNGVRDYGNKMGIPTVNGAILYHQGYMYNPLVFCGCLGILPHGGHPRQVQPGDKIVVLGGRTGRDGVHGATFSSGEMSSEINAQAGSAVQIGAPITEKKVADVIIQARDRQLYTAITDCGAGGFSSAIGEMGAETGTYVELEKAPLKYQGLAPWEIWLSEAQERMVLAVPPEKLDELLELCAIEEVEASIIGTFTADQRLTVSYHGQVVADMDMHFLHEGRPARTLEAVWVKNSAKSDVSASPIVPARSTGTMGDALLSLLSHPTIASKESVIRRYDHEVQGATVLKPLVGKAGNGPGDAAVLRPIQNVGAGLAPAQSTSSQLATLTQALPIPPQLTPARSTSSQLTLDRSIPALAGIILSNGINPLYGMIDPYHMAINAVDEALRNLTAVGGDIERAFILDNFCWGNPTDPLQLGMLVRAVKGCHDAAIGYGTPFISGKDSLNNEYRSNGERVAVIATLLISAVGVIDDAAQTIDMSLKQPGNLLYQIGVTRNELAGSHYAEILGESQSPTLQETDEAETEYSRGVPLRSRLGGVGMPTRSLWRWTGDTQYLINTTVPHIDIKTARITMKALGSAIRMGLIQSCHDLSEGGLAVAAAEMSLAGLLGMTINVKQTPHETTTLADGTMSLDDFNTILLFSESASRFLVEIPPEHQDAFEAYMQTHGVRDFACIGVVNNTERFVIQNANQFLIDLPVNELQAAWQGGEP